MFAPNTDVLHTAHKHSCSPPNTSSPLGLLSETLLVPGPATRSDTTQNTRRTQAWRDLYSFVILVMIPRTVLRMEEDCKSDDRPVLLRDAAMPIIDNDLAMCW